MFHLTLMNYVNINLFKHTTFRENNVKGNCMFSQEMTFLMVFVQQNPYLAHHPTD